MIGPISDDDFSQLIAAAMDDLPHSHIANMDNVAIVYADDPTTEQLEKQGVRKNHLLLGLYEGIPMTVRLSGSYSGVLPDKITLFKNPLRAVSADRDEFYQQIKRTLWHEIAHHYGLDHNDIDSREGR